MVFHIATSFKCSMICPDRSHTRLPRKTPRVRLSFKHIFTGQQVLAAATASAVAVVFVLAAGAIEVAAPQQTEETLSNIPQTLSSDCTVELKDCKKRYKIQHPKSRKAESCTGKCTTTCIQGGFGSPGEGPFNIRRPLVVFKEGFRSRKYCLSECSDICNLIGDGNDGP